MSRYASATSAMMRSFFATIASSAALRARSLCRLRSVWDARLLLRAVDLAVWRRY